MPGSELQARESQTEGGIGGTDAHAKHYSLLWSGDQVRLGPLYDIASALPDGRHERRLRLAMKIGSSHELVPQRNRWGAAARAWSQPDGLVERTRELARIAPDAFTDAVRASSATVLDRQLSDKLVNLVADRARRCLEVLDTSPTVAG